MKKRIDLTPDAQRKQTRVLVFVGFMALFLTIALVLFVRGALEAFEQFGGLGQ